MQRTDESAVGKQIETPQPELNWLNLGVFTVVAGRQPDGVSFAVYIFE
jgi:hypothetical protein